MQRLSGLQPNYRSLNPWGSPSIDPFPTLSQKSQFFKVAAGKKRLKAKLVNREPQQQEARSRRWKKSEEKENGGPESAGFSAQVAGKAKSKYSAIFNCTHTHTHTETRTHTHTYA